MANCTGETILNIRGGVCSAGPPAHPASASTDFHLKCPLTSCWLKPANAWFEGFSLSFATFSFSFFLFSPLSKEKENQPCVEGRLQCRPASASSARKYGFSSEKPFGKLLAQTCKRLVRGVFSFFCHLFFLFLSLFAPFKRERKPALRGGAFAVPARQCIQRPQVRIFIRKALWQAAGSNLQTLGSRGFLFLLPPFLSLFAPFKRERKGLFVHLQV